MRLIDADSLRSNLIRAIEKNKDDCADSKPIKIMCEAFIEILDREPTYNNDEFSEIRRDEK